MDRINCRLSVKCILVGVFSLFSLFFFSCENFMDSSVKDEITQEIYIANHESPVAKVEEPVFSDAGVAKNKAIKISFSMAMDPSTFANSYKIEDSAGTSLLACYQEPQWSNDNKLVVIYANEKNLISLNGKTTRDVYFKLSQNCTTKDKLPIKSAINHKYRVNDNVDNTPPTLSAKSYAERPQILFENTVISDSQKLVEGSITAANESQIVKTNHTNTKINFYIEGNDYGGGVVNGHLYVKRIKDVNGNDVSENETTKDYKIIEELIKQNDSDIYAGNYVLDLSSEEFLDGLYEIKLYVQDSSGIDSLDSKTYYVIRDTSFEFNVSSRVVFDAPRFRDDMTPGFDNDTLENPNMIDNILYDPDAPDDPVTNPQKVRYDIYSEVHQPNRDLSPEEEADDNVHKRWFWRAESKADFLSQYNEYQRQAATKEKLKDFQYKFFFDSFTNDTYYNSKLTDTSYYEDKEIYSYFLSWGLELDKLNKPVKLTGYKETDPLKQQNAGWTLMYDLPQAFINYLDKYENEDVIFAVTVLDSVGNQHSIYNLSPKKVEFYGYSVTDGGNGKKDVTINFSESIRNQISSYKAIPDKLITSIYRVFYAEKGSETLKRNTAEPFEKDMGDEISDSKILKGLESGKEYDVYIIQRYDMHSLTNGMWCSCTYSNIFETTISTSGSGVTLPATPAIDSANIKKEILGPNTGLVKITVPITNANSNLKYIPCFMPEKVFNNDRLLEEGSWTYYDAQALQVDNNGKASISFIVKNPLRAPMGKGEKWAPVTEKDGKKNWADKSWDGPIGSDGEVHGDYTYFQAANYCREYFGYDNVKAFVKIIATNGEQSKESDTADVLFNEDDDNIPPQISKDVSLHDGRLSYDGHFFEYESIITENEGHIAEFFNYYYAPYNPSWGDSLPEADSSIESLPGGKTEYKGTTWLDNAQGAMYSLPLSIPVYGLPDGEYMFFAKVYDTYGNYTYVTLGKANIGTFKNKLEVELVRDKMPDQDPNLSPEARDTILTEWSRHFKSTLKLEGYEQNFDRNMINLQEFAEYTDEYTGEEVERWGDYYQNLNQLQECEFDSAKGILWNYNLEQYSRTPDFTNDKAVYFLDDWDDEKKEQYKLEEYGGHYPTVEPKTLYRNHWYKLTVQSFNENYIIPGQRDNGVDRKYGRPYHYIWNWDANVYNAYTSDVLWYVDGETKYDVCTQETVSNTVYFYVPDEWIDDNGKHIIEDLSDFKASFFSSNARATSNHQFLVNIIAASRDLGRDADEWERRGKIVATHLYDPGCDEPQPNWYGSFADEAGKNPGDDGYEPNSEYNRYLRDLARYNRVSTDVNIFDYTVAQQDMVNSQEKGFVYYVAVVHFADGSCAVSDTYTMYGF